MTTSAPPNADRADLIWNSPDTELSASRTSLSFERTRLGADRTLMSTVRTSLSLISFGFTIHEVFSQSDGTIAQADASGRNLGLALLLLGIFMLAAGIASHTLFDRELGARRQRLYDLNLLRKAARYHATPTYLIAILLLCVGLLALADIAFHLF